jgi:hypothetical protein
VIKYLGSKRLLVGVLGEIATAVGATTALDLFTGTTRVAQEFKRRGVDVTAVDCATYSDVLAQCYIATDATAVDKDALAHSIDELNALAGKPGYFTETFCVQSRYFHPKNGERVDAMRDAIEERHSSSALYPVLRILTPPTTSTATSRTITCGKRWSAGTLRRTTASPANASTPAPTRRIHLSTASARCQVRSNPSSPARGPTWSLSRTTTNPW